jgi:hypothetical protein
MFKLIKYTIVWISQNLSIPRTLVVERVRGHPRDNYVNGDEYNSINWIYNKL